MITHYKIPAGTFVGCVHHNTDYSHYMSYDKLFEMSDMIERDVQQGTYFRYHTLKDNTSGAIYLVSVRDLEEILSYNITN